MPEYLWSGTSPSGQQGAAERIEADTVEAAKAILISKGWTNLQLHKGDVHAYTKRSMAANRGYEHDYTPKEELMFHKGDGSAFYHYWRKSLFDHKFNIAIFAFICLYGIYHGQIGLASVFGALLLVFIFLFPILHFRASGAKRLFRKLVAARTWRRWDEVLQCVDQFNKMSQRKRLGVGKAQLARYTGLALAGTGRIEEALKRFDEDTRSENMPEWMRLSQIGTMYNVAGQYDKTLEYRRRAAAATTDATPSLDLALCLLDHFNYVDEAKALLATIETKTVSDTAASAVPKLRGLIAYRENDFVSADRYLREALAAVEKKAKARYHLYEGSILASNAWLAVINAALGNKVEAEKFFKISHDYLVATKRQDLIETYNGYLNRSVALTKPTSSATL